MNLNKLFERQQQLIDEIEQHFGMEALEVAEDKKLKKDPYFIARDKELDEIESYIQTECF